MRNSIPDNLYIPFDHVAWLQSQCHDKELLLAWILGFRYGIGSSTAGRLQVENFYFKNGLPTGFYCRNGSRVETSANREWYVPIQPDDGALFKAILPPAGPLFSTRDPFGRLYRLAARGNIHLTQRRIRATCLANAQASGLYHEALRELGQFNSNHLMRHFLRVVPRREAQQYLALSVNPRDAARLPRLLCRKRAAIGR